MHLSDIERLWGGYVPVSLPTGNEVIGIEFNTLPVCCGGGFEGHIIFQDLGKAGAHYSNESRCDGNTVTGQSVLKVYIVDNCGLVVDDYGLM